ncbi:MAG: hypothetical protein K1563_01225 [Candidatus Thiodiazotropha sp. (ex. Lucinisca nassula)]|nr:hypothetical protein [Candidatus Thiodiazotropha sp. (ex. Lucinisca nassula)]MBW9272285.1 hypothetical protein [Candidatus Thiodiazotropha sp. (ex. Lucinisca nassula)]
MGTLKNLAVSLLSVVVLLLIVTNFSSVTTEIACSGEISTSNSGEPATLHAAIAEYRWWVGLWSDSDGDMTVEIPNQVSDYYGHLVKIGNQIQIHLAPGDIKGQYSMLSKSLNLELPTGSFEGECKKID